MYVVFAAFVYSLSLSYSDGACNDYNDCVTCTSNSNMFGPCRWCPRDEECHAPGNVFGNPCSREENVKYPNHCVKMVADVKYWAQYDHNLAYKMIYLCALAYSNDVAKYIPKASEVNTFQLVHQVTKPCSGDALCSGFVAIFHWEKAIAIAFRGSEHFKQVCTEVLSVLLNPKVSFQAGGKVQQYFLDAFQVVWFDLESYVYEQMSNCPNYKVWVTGHSLGGALAALASTLIMFNRKITKDNLMLYTFGEPRVGDYYYALVHDDLVPLSFRVTHYHDPVVHFPLCEKMFLGLIGFTCIEFSGGPYHHGKEIHYEQVMTKSSSYQICNKFPINEDKSCSNRFNWGKILKVISCIDDHKHYFGISVGEWWRNI